MSTDLSDEAAIEFSKRSAIGRLGQVCLVDGWRECRRRSEALIEERERKAFEAAWEYVDEEIAKMTTLDAAYRAFRGQHK